MQTPHKWPTAMGVHALLLLQLQRTPFYNRYGLGFATTLPQLLDEERHRHRLRNFTATEFRMLSLREAAPMGVRLAITLKTDTAQRDATKTADAPRGAKAEADADAPC